MTGSNGWRKTVLLGLLVAAVLSLAWPGFATAAGKEKEVPLNFDTQIIKIFEVAQTASAGRPEHEPGPEDRKALARILDKFRKHQMMLKNAVYRTDMGVIRITWADDDNIDIVKAAYKTNKDPVLGNSVHADKRQLISIKVMYRTAAGAYDYLHIENKDIYSSTVATGAKPAPPAFNYDVEGKLTNEQCKFCHILAQNDGSSKGIFFPRYQEFYKEYKPDELNPLFHADHFTRMPASAAKGLGLPNMGEDFLYQKVVVEAGVVDPPPENTRFARILIELPQLIEVMARDNKHSMCVAVDFGAFSEKAGFGRNDYVCANNAAQRLFVKLTNKMLSVNDGPKEYSEPYFEKY